MPLRGWCASPPLKADRPFQSRQVQLESGVRGNVPAPFGAGERLRSPTYRYPGVKRIMRPMLGCKAFDAAQSTLIGIKLMHMIK
jgi:hypothetical protein